MARSGDSCGGLLTAVIRYNRFSIGCWPNSWAFLVVSLLLRSH